MKAKKKLIALLLCMLMLASTILSPVYSGNKVEPGLNWDKTTKKSSQTKKQDVTKEEFIQALISGETDSGFIKKNFKRFGLSDKALFVMLICPQKGETLQLIDFT